jgi:Uma2 family endonuclease
MSHPPAHNLVQNVRAMHAETLGPAAPTLRADTALRHDDLVRRWTAAACSDEDERYELSEFGEWIVSPTPTPGHQRIAFAVGVQLAAQLGPDAAQEVPVLTDRGVRITDAIWMPPERWAELKDYSPLTTVPDVCVEVLSPGNTREEIMMKIGAYLRGGAREAIVVGLQGEIELFGPEGRREASALDLCLELPRELF